MYIYVYRMCVSIVHTLSLSRNSNVTTDNHLVLVLSFVPILRDKKDSLPPPTGGPYDLKKYL